MYTWILGLDVILYRHLLKLGSLVGRLAYFLPTYQSKKKNQVRLWPLTPRQRRCSHGCLMLWAAWKKEPLCLPSLPLLRKWRKLQSTRGLMTLPTTTTTTQHMQLDSVSLAHRRTLYSIWQARTGSGRPPRSARCFATTAGLLSCPSAPALWMPFLTCSHTAVVSGRSCPSLFALLILNGTDQLANGYVFWKLWHSWIIIRFPTNISGNFSLALL